MAAQIMAAQTETSGGEPVEYLSVEPASQTPFWSVQGQMVVVGACCGPGCLALWSEFCRPHPALPLPRGKGLATWHLYAQLRICSVKEGENKNAT